MSAITTGLLLSSTSQPQVFHSIRTRKPLSPLHKYLTCLASTPSHPRMAAASTDGADTREVNQGIAQFYDQSTGVWEDIWGDHIHYGFCDPVSGTESDYRAAQIRMIEEALSFAGVSEDPGKRPKNALDVGCGIGGTTKYIARKYGAKCIGINLSPIQIQRANALAAAEGLADKVSFQVADALEQPFSDGQFDLVLSVECGEYIPDKRKFAAELARVTAPGGKIVILSFCHRDLGPSEESLQPWELKRLKKIYDAFQIQGYCSAADYVNFFESLSLQDIKTADWTQYIAPFLPLLFRSALTWKGLSSLLPSLLRGGMKTLRAVLVLPLDYDAFKKGLYKYTIITCRKPE